MSMHTSSTPPAAQRAGFALITTLLILVMLTLLAVAMFRGFGLQQKIAGTTREKERAFQAAQNALQYGEWWLTAATPGTGVVCSSQVTITGAADMRSCSNPMTQAMAATPDQWTGSSLYKPPAMAVQGATDANGTAVDGNNITDINYAQTPQLYVAYLGPSKDQSVAYYSVTAAGYGGTDDTRAVVQSVYAITSPVRDPSAK